MYDSSLGHPLRTFVRFCYVMLTNVAWHAFCVEGSTDVNSFDEQFWGTCELWPYNVFNRAAFIQIVASDQLSRSFLTVRPICTFHSMSALWPCNLISLAILFLRLGPKGRVGNIRYVGVSVYLFDR